MRNTLEEINELIEWGVPIHAFHVDKYARASFELLSQRTKGKCEALDIHSKQGADMLTHLVT